MVPYSYTVCFCCCCDVVVLNTKSGQWTYDDSHSLSYTATAVPDKPNSQDASAADVSEHVYVDDDTSGVISILKTRDLDDPIPLPSN